MKKNKIFKFLSSLKLAVTNIACLAFLLAVATIVESQMDTPTARYWVYDTFYFRFLLGLFGVNILAVALSRYPWKLRQVPFLVAHLGILLLLYGSFITYKVGIDGSMRLQEGESSSIVELNDPIIVAHFSRKTGNSDEEVLTAPFTWIPPNLEFKPITFKNFHFKIDQFFSHADSQVDFISSPNGAFAVQLELRGGLMKIRQKYWLWGGDLTWMNIEAGPARIELLLPDDSSKSSQKPFAPSVSPNGPRLYVQKFKDKIFLIATSPTSGIKGIKKVQVPTPLPESLHNEFVFNPGWKGGVDIRVLKIISSAVPQIHYSKSKIQYGSMAPSPALRVVPFNENKIEGNPVWLGLGDHARLEVDGQSIDVAFLNRRVMLPYAVRLDKFQMDYYEGTRDPSQYSSMVSLVGEPSPPVWIKMNEPLTYKGFTFYQASYEPGEPRPTVSILSINQDPGRKFKYLGSLLIVLGSALLFFVKMRERKKTILISKGLS